MADDNQQWPSEDEDFDATASSGASPTTSTESASRPVTINDVNDEQQPEEPAQEEQPAEEHQEYPDEDPQSEAPAEAAVEPVAAVASEAPKQPKAPKPPKAPGSGQPIGRSVAEVVLVVAVIALGLWAWSLKSDNTSLKAQVVQLNANPQLAVQKQTQALIDQVGKLIQLPTGETPTIANVTDATQAKQQSAFFANAQNGDKVLMYVKAGEAILYRPSTGKIVLVAPLTFSNNAASTTGTTSTKK